MFVQSMRSVSPELGVLTSMMRMARGSQMEMSQAPLVSTRTVLRRSASSFMSSATRGWRRGSPPVISTRSQGWAATSSTREPMSRVRPSLKAYSVSQ